MARPNKNATASEVTQSLTSAPYEKEVKFYAGPNRIRILKFDYKPDAERSRIKSRKRLRVSKPDFVQL